MSQDEKRDTPAPGPARKAFAALPAPLQSWLRRARRPAQNTVLGAFRTRYASATWARWDGPAFFLVGSARSGTTLLARVVRAAEGVDLHIEPRETFGARLGLSIFDRRFLGLTSIDALREEIYESRRGLLREGRVYGEKWPGNALLIRELADVFPRARFVHIVRDGRAVADSALRRYGGEWLTGRLNAFTNLAMNQQGYDSSLPLLARGGLRWKLQVQAAQRAAAELGGDRALTLRYERLLAEPEQTVRQLFDFLGVAFDPARLPCIQARESARWRAWSPEDREAFHRVAGDLLVELGYADGPAW